MMRSSSRGSRSPTGRSARSAAWTSRPVPAASSACSAPTGRARPPRCGSSPPCSQPDAGSARVAGLDVVRDAAALRAKIGLAGQYAAVDENLTGFENLEMVGQLYHMPRKEAQARADELLERFELTEAAKRPGQDLLRRHAPPARPRRRARVPAARAVPRRAHHGPRPALAAEHVGDDRGAHGRGHDRAAHHAVPRGGRPPRRPDRGDRPRQRDRRGHGRRAQGPRRRRAARGAPRGPGGRRARDRARWPRCARSRPCSRTAWCACPCAGARA